MMNNIFLQSWHRHVPSPRLFLFISGFISRIVPKAFLREIRGYKIVRAYGFGLPLAIAGSGIPQKILNKIFQPFFNTKPTGQGTRVGLSLSYDIVKAHGGELKVETRDGQGSKFIMLLPVL